MYALIDCNSFYASCEKLFRPDLKDKPVVVLSKNDGCIATRYIEVIVISLYGQDRATLFSGCSRFGYISRHIAY